MKYIVYKISGGLAHMLMQINNVVHLSKVTNRYLIIDCITGPMGGAFNNDFNKYFNIPNLDYATNYTPLYNDQHIKKNLFESYIKTNTEVHDGVYFLRNKIVSFNFNDVLQSSEEIIYCTRIYRVPNMEWYIKVNKDVVDKISINKIGDKYIGIHYRNTDMKHNLEQFISQITKLSENSKIIYLGTDDFTAFDRLNILLENKFNIIQYTKPIDTKGKSIHYGNPNKDEVIINALIDMYHLTYATYFIPSNKSSFSKRIIKLRENDSFFK